MLCDHIVGSSILLPGVGYVELAFSAIFDGDLHLTSALALIDIAFIRPCVISSEPGVFG